MTRPNRRRYTLSQRLAFAWLWLTAAPSIAVHLVVSDRAARRARKAAAAVRDAVGGLLLAAYCAAVML